MAALTRTMATAMLRTGRGPLRPLWAAVHAVLLRAASLYLRARTGGAAYVRGGFAAGEPVHGLSDIDLVVVLPPRGGALRESVELRWERALRAFPPLGDMVSVKLYEQDELADACRATVLTHERAIFTDGHPHNRHYSIRTRPGLAGPGADWRRVAGRDRRPRPVQLEPLVAAWLELQWWWRYAVWACANPGERHVPYLCVKLVGEGARVWLWLAHGQRVGDRIEALRRGLRLMPRDEPTLRLALDLHGRLPRSPEPPLEEVIGWLVGLSSRIAERVAGAAQTTGVTGVRLRWDRPSPAENGLPLVDWRALVMAGPAQESFVLSPARPDPRSLAAVASSEERGRIMGLRAPGLLLLPSADLRSRPFPRGTLRCVQCAASDPVSLALCDGGREALFPELPGWSARDWARRAVTEQRARLDGGDTELGTLFRAARAALFADSLERGEPELALTAADVASSLRERDGNFADGEPATALRSALRGLRLLHPAG